MNIVPAGISNHGEALFSSAHPNNRIYIFGVDDVKVDGQGWLQ
jgi:hypothetical protein